MTIEAYHYEECGLDNVWLYGGGVEIIDLPAGRHVKIKDVEGLHKEIGRFLTEKKGDLTGPEIRFLRQELLLSQAMLAKLLGVTEQTVHRWEKAKADITKVAERNIRLMYRQARLDSKGIQIMDELTKLAQIEHEIDGHRISLRKQTNKPWHVEKLAA